MTEGWISFVTAFVGLIGLVVLLRPTPEVGGAGHVDSAPIHEGAAIVVPSAEDEPSVEAAGEPHE